MAKKKTVTKKTSRKAPNAAPEKKGAKVARRAKADDGLLKHALDYVKKSGGLEKAKAALAELEAILEAIIP